LCYLIVEVGYDRRRKIGRFGELVEGSELRHAQLGTESEDYYRVQTDCSFASHQREDRW